MAFDDAGLERALRAETKSGLEISADGVDLTIIGYGWMAVVPLAALRSRLRGTLGALVEMLGYIPAAETVRLWKNKGDFMVQTELPEAFADSVCEYAGETEEEEIRATPLRMGAAVLMQKRGGEIVGVSSRAPALNIKKTTVTPGGIVRQEDEDAGERLYRLSRRPRADTDSETEVARWKHLEAIAWCDWNAPEE